MSATAAGEWSIALPPATALPLDDGLVLVTAEGALCALNAAGRGLWEALAAGTSVNELVAACVDEGGLTADEAHARIADAVRSWRELGLFGAATETGSTGPDGFAPPVVRRRAGRRFALDAIYLVGDRPVRVRCDDPGLGELIDAACAPFRREGATKAEARVDLIERDGWFVVRAKGTALAAVDVPTQGPARARHRCLTALIEAARPGRRWLGILHTAAVSEGDGCVLLAGASGSGKSTLAAALVATGARFVTDDYAPLERGSWRVWPVPYAPSLKRGSWPVLARHFPDLDGLRVYEHRELEMRYLPLDPSRWAPLDEALPVRALVFPRYEAGAGLDHRRLSAVEALTGLCHTASMLDTRAEVLEETLRWVQAVPAYELAYGDDLDAAVGWVRPLLLGGRTA